MITLKLRDYNENEVKMMTKGFELLQATITAQERCKNQNCSSCPISKMCSDIQCAVTFLENEIADDYPHIKRKEGASK